MENQHRKIKGYRELSQQEIDLMNRVKAKGAEILALHDELEQMLVEARYEKQQLVKETEIGSAEEEELKRFGAAEPFKWCAMGKADIQTGIMALVRAVAQPDGV